MARPQGGRNALIRVTYDTIAQMAGGIRGDTARRYAQRRLYDPRDLDSMLSWVNRRRAAQGLPLIGIPDGDNPAVSDDADAPVEASMPESIKPVLLAGGLYDPMTGEFRGCDDGRTR